MNDRYVDLPGDSVNKKHGLSDIVLKNNQGTLLLNREFVAEIKLSTDEEKNMQSPTYMHKMVAFQGDTRIFFFDYGKEGDLTNEEEKKRLDQCQNLLLMIYVAPIIRIMKMAISFFYLLDNTSFACLLLLLFGGNILSKDDHRDIGDIFDGRHGSTTAILIAIFSDLLHNILHASTRLWNLTRIDLPLVLTLYLAYFIIMRSMGAEWVYWYLLSFRFVSYYVSTCCNYWEDIMVLKIIRKMKAGGDFKLPNFLRKGVYVTKLEDKFAFPHHRLSQDDVHALKFFLGSFCCWNWSRSGFRFLEKYHGDKQQITTSKWGHLIFLPGGVIALVTAFFLMTVLIMLGLIPLIFAASVGFIMKCFCIRCQLPIFDEVNMW